MKFERTIPLFEEDPYLQEFDARILRISEDSGRTQVILDRTAFYPASGGQPCDLGILNGTAVTDVIEHDGQIVHTVKGGVPSDPVHGKIDWARRFDHMQQHTGQHMLSQAFFRITEAMTVGFHLGDTLSTIDLDGLTPTDACIHSVETMANEIIFENRPVNRHWIKRENIKTVPLRKPPAVDGDIRVVEIDGFDHVACCGTHVMRTGEIGLVKIVKHERYKGGARITFVCGKRAFEDYAKKTVILREACGHLTVGEEDLVQTVVRWKEEKRQTARQMAAYRSEALQAEAAGFVDDAVRIGPWRVVKQTLADREIDDLKALSKAICQMGSVVALLALRAGNGRLCFSRSPDVELDMNTIMQNVFEKVRGKGGGQPSFVQGSCEDPDTLDEALELAIGIIRSGRM